MPPPEDELTPEIAVVVVAYNNAPVIEGLLTSLPAAMTGHTYRAVVVDNGSTDDTAARARSAGGTAVVVADNRGFAAGINVGVAALPVCETILVLNADVRLDPGFADAALGRMRSTGAGVVAPRLRNADGSLAMSLRREPTLLRSAGLGFIRRPWSSIVVDDEAAYDVAGPFSWAVGAVLLISRRCYDDVGGWDESYFLYSEETDFCLRAADRGWSLEYEPSATAEHIGGASGRSGLTQSMQALNQVRLYARRHRRLPAWVFFGLTVLGELRRAVRGDAQSRHSVMALLVPRRRPAQLNCSASLLPL